jgi:hypothetical protein
MAKNRSLPGQQVQALILQSRAGTVHDVQPVCALQSSFLTKNHETFP